MMKTPLILAGQVVTIPAREYAELLDCQRRLAELNALRRPFERFQQSPIERDPELAAFIADRLGTACLWDIHSAILKRFGKPRTPSKSAIHRYGQRLRARTVPALPG
jgi:hypothetical protein